MAAIDVEKVKNDFPIFDIKVGGKPLVYLDSAATSQKPRKVINAISKYYKRYNANIHRGVYKIAEQATEEYIKSKKKVAKLVNADSGENLVYTRNTTESINMVSYTWAEQNVGSGDHILVTDMEHHSNIVPWQMLAKRKGAILDYISLNNEHSELDEESIETQLAKNPKLLAITHCSNVLGTIVDVKSITRKAHQTGAKVLVDGAQSVPHMPVDIADIGCDFLAFSGHKMLGPTGIGVLYAKHDILEESQPFLGGGDMIKTVERQDFTPNDVPWKFEAGTPNIEGGIALGVAVDYLRKIGMGSIREHEKMLTRYALEKLSGIDKVNLFGLPVERIESRGGVVPFAINGIHPHDVATIFDSEGIAIRAGHHCAMPLVVEILKEPALSRISFYLYNNERDVDAAVAAINKAKSIFKIQ
ncbi:MAG: cysteine desulfurase [Candidatus Marsarchaeota archaeon]|nr:cysteine desulfurase [Candidatus Marsarchaeota archaeon]